MSTVAVERSRAKEYSVAFWVAIVLATAAVAVFPPLVGPIALGLIALIAWQYPLAATAVAAISAYLIRPTLDAFGSVRVGGANPAVAFGILMLVVGVTVGARRFSRGVPIMPDVRFGRMVSSSIVLHALMLVSGVMAMGATGIQSGLREYIRFFSTLAAGMLIVWWAMERKPERLRQVWTLVIAGSVVPMLVGAYQALTGTGNLLDEGLNRIYGTFTHPQTYAAFLIPLVMIGVAGVIRMRGGGRGVALGWLATSLLLLMLTYSRTFILVLIVAIGVFLVMQFVNVRVRLRDAVGIGLTTAIVVVVGWLVFGEAIRARFEGIVISSGAVQDALTSGSQNSFQWRVLNWVTLIQLGRTHLWMGHGLGMTSVLNPIVDTRSNIPFNAHNDFVRYFFEGGLFGLGLYVLFLVFLGYWLWTVARETRAPWSIESNAIAAALASLFLLSAGTPEMSLATGVLYQVYALFALLVALRNRGMLTGDSRSG